MLGENISGFDVSVSAEQLERIRSRYEFLRKTEQYRGLRVKKTFQPKAVLEDVDQKALDKITLEDRLRLELSINFPAAEEGEVRWREYGSTLQRLFAALAKKSVPPDIGMRLTQTWKELGYDISSEIIVGEEGKEEVVKRVLATLRLFLYPDCTRYALEPIRIMLTGHGNHVLQNESFRLGFYLEKSPCQDYIILDDVPLVVSYYRQIADIVLKDIAHRGLTVYAAVDAKDGESVIRRNNARGERMVADDVEDIGRLVLDYDAFRFVPDVNLHGQECISRIPVDMDTPPTMTWADYAEFVNGFKAWLEEHGFKPRLRLTGGRGAQVILDISMDRLAKNYSTPFPRALKFETWIGRVGKWGLISAQASDLVKILALAYADYRKKLGKSAPLTVEMHDLSQRYWNILADSSRAVKDMGVVGVGSIHHKTGAVCMPVASLPPTFSIESAVSASHWPDIERVEYQPRFKSPWIQTVGSNPVLLHEPSLSCRDNTFSLVEEAFEKYSWIPNEYVRMGSERFMGKYCWA